MEKFVVWEDKFSVGNYNIDEQHKALFNIINELFLDLEKENRDEVIGKGIDALMDYTDYHFRLEQIVMRDMEYPKINEHIELHDFFLSKIELFKEQTKVFGATNISKKLLGFLAGWLQDHILVEDGKYAAFEKSRSTNTQ